MRSADAGNGSESGGGPQPVTARPVSPGDIPAPGAPLRGRGAVEDWAAVLQRLVAGDPVAHVRVTGVIMGLIIKARMFDLEPLWEDICQDVLTAIVRSVQTGAIRDPAAFVGYCAVITRNELSRRLEQVRRSRARDDGADADALPEPARRDQDMDLLIDMSRALDLLPERIRNTLQAIYLEGRSYEDASAQLAIPLGTLKRMQTQGLRMLREKMGAA